MLTIPMPRPLYLAGAMSCMPCALHLPWMSGRPSSIAVVTEGPCFTALLRAVIPYCDCFALLPVCFPLLPRLVGAGGGPVPFPLLTSSWPSSPIASSCIAGARGLVGEERAKEAREQGLQHDSGERRSGARLSSIALHCAARPPSRSPPLDRGPGRK